MVIAHRSTSPLGSCGSTGRVAATVLPIHYKRLAQIAITDAKSAHLAINAYKNQITTDFNPMLGALTVHFGWE